MLTLRHFYQQNDIFSKKNKRRDHPNWLHFSKFNRNKYYIEKLKGQNHHSNFKKNIHKKVKNLGLPDGLYIWILDTYEPQSS